MAFFWQDRPNVEDLDDLPDPGAAEEEIAQKEAAEKMPGMLALAADQEEERPAAVQWPPVKPLPPAEYGKPPGSRSRGGRHRDRLKREKNAAENAVTEKKDGGNKEEEKANKPRKEGWLPKAEYEAKKRAERSERQRQREAEQAASAQHSGRGGKSGGKGSQRGGEGKNGKESGKKSEKSSGKSQETAQFAPAERGRGGRGGRGWDELPPRPPPPEETAEVRQKQQKEEAQLRTRDRLRNASSAEEMRSAIAAAKELGLTQEASVGERKLSRMTCA